MAQHLSLQHSQHEITDTSLNRMLLLQAEHDQHRRHLQTIYQQRQQIRSKAVRQHSQRQGELQQYQRIQLRGYSNKARQAQDRINYENAILRNKILGILSEKRVLKESRSAYVGDSTPSRLRAAEEMNRTNIKLGRKLMSVQSDIRGTNDPEEIEARNRLMNMLRKHSPEKKAYMKSLSQKKQNATKIGFLPELYQIE